MDGCSGKYFVHQVEMNLNQFDHVGIFSPFTMQSREKPMEKLVGKGENGGNQHFFLFPHSFLWYQSQNSIIWAILRLTSANTSDLP